MTDSSSAPVSANDSGDEDDRFFESVKPVLESLESIRLEKRAIYLYRRKWGTIAAIVGMPVTGFIDHWLLLLQSHSDDQFTGLTFGFLAMIYAWVSKPKRDYRRAYKQDMLPRIARLFGDFIYEAKGRIPMAAMMPSKIVPQHDKYESEDYFKGHYKGAEICFSEINLKQRRRSDKRTYYVSVFKGLAVTIGMKPNKFFGHTIMIKDSSSLGEWFKEKNTGLKRANLVDPQFEKMFDVYTNDQVEARYLIDPVMIEKMKKLSELYETKGLSAAFYDSRLLILMKSNKNYFEPASIHVKATDEQTLLRMKREVGQIMTLVDYLALYSAEDAHKQVS